MTLFTYAELYGVTGAVIAALALRIGLDRTRPARWGSVLFWGLLSLLYLAGDRIPVRWVAGVLLVLVALGLSGSVRRPAPAAPDRESRRFWSQRLGNRLFLLPLIVPAGAVAGGFLLGRIHLGRFRLADPRQAGVLAVSLSAIMALAVSLRVTRARLSTPLREGGRILETFGWLLLLPQLLASLGGVLIQAGLGDLIGSAVARVLPVGSPFAVVAGYCVAMAALTACLGNAFAAFAVVTSGIGLPLIVRLHHGDPAIMAAIGMLSGYCGTLITPMAANFNLVPALLLELSDRNSVIRAQAPVAALVLAANILLMGLCVYRF